MIKTAKRLCVFLLAALICTAAGTAVCSAAGKTYTIHELNEMQLVLNDDISAVTRDADASDSYFSQHGLDYAATIESMKSNNIYLQGTDSMSSITLTVSMTETDESKAISGYQLLGYKELSEIASNFIADPAYTACTIDEASAANWLIFDKVDETGGKQVFQANTVYGGKIINVTLQRNGGNVIGSDYAVLDSIVSSVTFGSGSAGIDMSLFLIIGAVVLVILAVIVLMLIIRHAKLKSKKNKNDKILEELAGQYSKPRRGYSEEQPEESGDTSDDSYGNYEDISSFGDESAYDGGYVYEDEPSAPSADDDFDSYDVVADAPAGGTRKFSDDEINALPGDEGDSEDFTVALPEPEEEPKTEQQNAAQLQTEATEATEAAEAAEAEDVISDDPEPQPEEAADEPAPSEELTEPVDETAQPEPEPAPIEPEEAEEKSEPEEEKAEEPEEVLYSEGLDNTEEFARVRYDLSEFEERDPVLRVSDEAQVREESKQSRFKQSDDFFEEAPKRTVGVLSREDIAEAEEYDVIGEVEKRAGELEKEPPRAADSAKSAVKKVGDGFKYFGTHMGYFATNVSHEIKRSRAKRKRKKAEEERRARASERASQQRPPQKRQQPRPDGLVQVRSRDNRRPPNKNRRG